MRRYIIIAIVALIVIIPVILITSGAIRRPPGSAPAVSLTYWTVDNDPIDLQPLVDSYAVEHPYVSIVIKKIPAENYQQTLLNAWALDQGPDIFSLPNTWVRQYADFIQPLPPTVSVYQYTTKKVFFRDQVEVRPITVQTLSQTQIQQRFIDAVADDVILQLERRGTKNIYALPLSTDNLVLYYNRDLLNAAGIAEPATTWKEMTDQAPLLTVLDNQNNVLQSAISIGTATNVNHAADIWSLLALQNGTQMIDPANGDILFNEEINSYGIRALEFYTDFADFAKEVYSWNNTLPGALDAFAQGKVGYFMGYNSDQTLIKELAPTLNIGVAPTPHINVDGTDAQLSTSGLPVPVSFAAYWLETVAQKSAHPNEAWDFLQFASSAGMVEPYLEATGKISALRSLLSTQTNDPEKSVFASQALNARTWYHGTAALEVEVFLESMIDSVAEKRASATSAINLAAEQTNQTLPL